MADDAERKENREKLVEWFLANPGASVDASLKAATKDKRALGLTMSIAAMMKRDADAQLKRREAEEAERRRLELLRAPPVPMRRCTRCQSTEHWVSECPVIVELPPPPPPPLPVFDVDGDRDDEGVWVAAGQFLFEKFAEGHAFTTPQAYEVVAKLGPKRFWADALLRLNGRVFEMTASDAPGGANLWACRRDREGILLEIASSPELTAGALWNGTETARVNKLLEEPDDEPVKETSMPPPVNGVPANVPSPQTSTTSPPTPATAGLVPTLQAILKLSQASVTGQGLLKSEIDLLRGEVAELKGLKEQLATLISLLNGGQS